MSEKNGNYEKVEDFAEKLGRKIKKMAVCGKNFVNEKLECYEHHVPKVVRQTAGIGLIALGGAVLGNSVQKTGQDEVTIGMFGATVGAVLIGTGAASGMDKKERNDFILNWKQFSRED